MTPDEARSLIVGVLGRIAPEIDFASVDPSESLRDQLDIDSMDFLNAIIAIDEQIGVEIPEEDYEQLETMDGAVAYLVAHAG